MRRRPAIFLDRDGVINKEVSYVTSLEKLEIFPYVKDCIERIHNCGYLAIVISNQSAIGRGMMTEEGLLQINSYIEKMTGIDKIYYCPHWRNHESKVSKYNKKCSCRKPDTGLIDKAKREYNIQMEESYFIGDRDTDIITGKNKGIKTVLVKSGYCDISSALEWNPEFICEDLREFVALLEKDFV